MHCAEVIGCPNMIFRSTTNPLLAYRPSLIHIGVEKQNLLIHKIHNTVLDSLSEYALSGYCVTQDMMLRRDVHHQSRRINVNDR